MDSKITDLVNGRKDGKDILAALKIDDNTKGSKEVLASITSVIQAVDKGEKLADVAVKQLGQASIVKSSQKTKAVTKTASTQPVGAELPKGIKDTLGKVVIQQAKATAPQVKTMVAEVLTSTEQGTMNAIAGYSVQTYQDALMAELNDPNFLKDLEDMMSSGKSQT